MALLSHWNSNEHRKRTPFAQVRTCSVRSSPSSFALAANASRARPRLLRFSAAEPPPLVVPRRSCSCSCCWARAVTARSADGVVAWAAALAAAKARDMLCALTASRSVTLTTTPSKSTVAIVRAT